MHQVFVYTLKDATYSVNIHLHTDELVIKSYNHTLPLPILQSNIHALNTFCKYSMNIYGHGLPLLSSHGVYFLLLQVYYQVISALALL